MSRVFGLAATILAMGIAMFIYSKQAQSVSGQAPGGNVQTIANVSGLRMTWSPSPMRSGATTRSREDTVRSRSWSRQTTSRLSASVLRILMTCKPAPEDFA